MTRHFPTRSSSRGFTLLEVIVAFSIAAISLGALLAIFSTGLRNSRVTREYSVAVALAESKLAEIGTVEPLQQTPLEGQFDDKYSWRTEIAEYTEIEGCMPSTVQPYRVSVEVSWTSIPRDRSVTLTTLRFLDGS